MESNSVKILLGLLIFISMLYYSSQKNIDYEIIDQYIEELMTKSTADIPVWNIEKAKAGKKSGWDYIDGCMIMALLEIYSTTKDNKYLEFADYYEDYRISDDGTIDGYKKEEWNLDNINGAKNLITLYTLTKKKNIEKPQQKYFNKYWSNLKLVKEISGIKKYIQIKFGLMDYIWHFHIIWSMKCYIINQEILMIYIHNFLMFMIK